MEEWKKELFRDVNIEVLNALQRPKIIEQFNNNYPHIAKLLEYPIGLTNYLPMNLLKMNDMEIIINLTYKDHIDFLKETLINLFPTIPKIIAFESAKQICANVPIRNDTLDFHINIGGIHSISNKIYIWFANGDSQLGQWDNNLSININFCILELEADNLNELENSLKTDVSSIKKVIEEENSQYYP